MKESELAGCRSRSGTRLAESQRARDEYEYVQTSGFEVRQILELIEGGSLTAPSKLTKKNKC